MFTDLVDRLKKAEILVTWPRGLANYQNTQIRDTLCNEAAVEIMELRAEIARLQGLMGKDLSKIADQFKYLDDEADYWHDVAVREIRDAHRAKEEADRLETLAKSLAEQLDVEWDADRADIVNSDEVTS